MQHLDVVLVHRLIRQKDRGLTLLEILVVLIIIGILTAIAVPSLLQITLRANLPYSVERVRETLELSRIQATQKSKKCNIYIPTGNQIVSSCLISADSSSSGIAGVPNTTGLPSVKLDDRNDIEIKNSDSSIALTRITYNSRGITQSSGTLVLSSRSSRAEQKCLIVAAGVGLISIGNYINNTCQVGQ